MKKYISMILKLIVFLASFIGVIFSIYLPSNGLVGGYKALLYFTTQSNLWIGIVCLICFILDVIKLKTNKNYYNDALYVIKYVFSISITLTGFVFCFVLAPAIKVGVWTIANVLTHVITPLAAIVDLFLQKDPIKYKVKHQLFTLIPPLYYLVFSIICFVSNVTFAYGQKFPYFFLNWSSPAGFFGFSNEMPYFMGTFYWLIALLLFVLLIAYLYALIKNKQNKK